MIVLIDYDILIDVALDRTLHSSAASELLDAVEERALTGFVAWHTIANFYYLVRTLKGASGTRDFIVDLLRFVEVAPTSTESVRYAAGLPMPDFEDALQSAAALACGASAIASRNVRDYARSSVKALTPAAILKELSR